MNSQFESPNLAHRRQKRQLSQDALVAAANSKGHILRNLAVESVWGLLEHCPLLELKPGSCLVEKHTQHGALFIVFEGKLKAYLTEEREREIAQFCAGHTVGELSVIDGSLTSAYVVADSSCSVLQINEDTFWR